MSFDTNSPNPYAPSSTPPTAPKKSNVLMWVLLAVGFVYVLSQADDPGMPLVLTMLLLGGGTVGMLMVVMRALLRQATTLRTDMEAVI